jgi:hypothetical protein
MATTPTDPTALDNQRVLGETLFLSGAILSFLSEVILTFRSLVALNTIGTLLGVVFIVGTVVIIDRLYAGKTNARRPALAWIALQIVIAIVGIVLLSSHRADSHAWAERLSVSSIYFGAFKAAAYGLFGFLLTQTTPALFFLRQKAGEHVEVPTAAAPLEEVAPAGVSVPVAAADMPKVASLASMLQWAGSLMMIAGFFVAVASGLHVAGPQAARLPNYLHFAEGLVLLLLGLSLLVPARAVRNVAERGTDANFALDSIAKLASLSYKQVILAAALLAITVAILVLRFQR